MVQNQDLYFIKNKFSDVKKKLETSLNNSSIFNDFVRPLLVYDLEGNKVVLLAPSDFVKSTVNNNYLEQIKNSLNKICRTDFDVCVLTHEDVDKLELNQKRHTSTTTQSFFNESNVNQKYIFDNFVVSFFNKSAYEGVFSVVKSKNWNPIFLCGGVGLGKTHLLNALGNEYLKIYPKSVVRYVTSDDFVREVYRALSSDDAKKIEKLKDQYQSCDLLLFDDIQFLSNKEKINEIFFNIFNYNISHNKFVVMCSDKLPNQLPNFANRLKSRFSSGLIVKIGKPSVESICEILKYKISESKTSFIFTNESVLYIARRNQNDIRKLQGFLNQILFFVDNNLQPGAIITPSIIQQATDVIKNDIFDSNKYEIDPNIVIDQVCLSYGISSNIVKSKSRRKDVSIARSVCIYVLRKKFNMTFEEIGSFFSNRNHSTIIECYNKIEKIVNKDDDLKKFITKIYSTI